MMHAAVTGFQVQPGKMDDAIRAFESLVPGLKSQRGFVSGLALTDRAANKATAVTLWETLADLEASEPYRQQPLASPSVAALFAGAPVREVYEVAVQVAANR